MTASPALPPGRWRALPVLLTAIFMGILDVFVVNVAAPSIGRELHASDAALQWVLAAYQLGFAIALVTGGRLGDVVGRRRMFRIGVALFTATSALCGAAPTPASLIAARALQGVSAAMMWPQVLSVIQVSFAPHERARCLAIMGAVQGLASVTAQLVGGALIGLDVLGLGWRAVFLVNVPIGIAGVVAGRVVPESRSERAGRLDLVGVALATALLALVMLPIVEGREAGWPWWVPAALAAAIPVGALFAAHERRLGARGGAPLVDLRLLAVRGFRVGLVAAWVLFWLTSFFLFLSLYLQDGLGRSPVAAGLAVTPVALAYAAAAMAARTRGDWTIPAGAGLIAVALAGVIAALAASDGAYRPELLLPPCSLFGAGMGLVVPSLLGSVLRSVPPADAGTASGMVSTAQQVGNASGVAIAGTAFFGALGGGQGSAAFGHAFAIACAVLGVAALAGAAMALRMGERSSALGTLRRVLAGARWVQ